MRGLFCLRVAPTHRTFFSPGSFLSLSLSLHFFFSFVAARLLRHARSRLLGRAESTPLPREFAHGRAQNTEFPRELVQRGAQMLEFLGNLRMGELMILDFLGNLRMEKLYVLDFLGNSRIAGFSWEFLQDYQRNSCTR